MGTQGKPERQPTKIPEKGVPLPTASSHFNTPAPTQTQNLEMASVLFLDIVKYSLKPMDWQRQVISQLQQIVRNARPFKSGSAGGNVISLPTGDGMAIVFFHDPVAAVACALEIARDVQKTAGLWLRMGIHNGPVYRHADIKDALNVVGSGINLAQRVMDCGDAGHILVSQSVADVLSQLSGWAECLHDLGECQVKHGMTVHLYNVYEGDLGNPARPAKLVAQTSLGTRPWASRLAFILIPPLVVTLGLRWFFNTSPVTRDRPLTFTSSFTIFLIILMTLLVIRWLTRLSRKKS